MENKYAQRLTLAPSPKRPWRVGDNSQLARGFTLIELLIVIAVIGALSSIVIITFPAAQKRARDSQRKSDIKQYQTSLESYANKNDGSYFDTSGSQDITDYCLATYLDLSGAACVDDPQGANLYQINSVNTEYTIWNRLEMPNSSGQTLYFAACSTGVSGERTSVPGSSTCPDPF